MNTNTKRIGLFFTLVCTLGAISAFADGTTSNAPAATASADSNALVKAEVLAPWHPVSLSLEAGTTGGGGTLGIRFLDHIGICGGADTARYSIKDQSYGDINYNGTARLMTENAGLRLYPSKDASFFLCLGAVFNQNHVNATADGSVTVNGTPYVLPPGEYLKLHYEQQPVSPFASIGGNFFYFDSAHHWSFGGELGAFLLGNPKVTLENHSSVPIPPSDMQAQQQKIVDDLKKVTAWPIIKLQISYAF